MPKVSWGPRAPKNVGSKDATDQRRWGVEGRLPCPPLLLPHGHRLLHWHTRVVAVGSCEEPDRVLHVAVATTVVPSPSVSIDKAAQSWAWMDVTPTVREIENPRKNSEQNRKRIYADT